MEKTKWGETMKSLQEKVFDYIKENPNTEYKQIEEALSMKSDARVYVHRLKKKGIIEGDTVNGFKIMSDYNPVKPTKSRETYLEMIEYYLEDFREAETFDERLRIGKEIRLLLDQVD